ncbi:MAG: hypothetical protein LBH57_04950 [Treponema sp.]|jgi:hypothetical protein|nr:hypothetical protein [Treponema sp.]
MKYHLTAVLPAILLAASLILGACPVADEEGTESINYVSFPEDEILGASFYAGDGVLDPGFIEKNADGTYRVRIKRRAPSSSPVAMFITGSFSFSGYYSITCTFPEDPAITNKPNRVYVMASTNLDLAVDADYPTAWDSRVFTSFRNDEATGRVVMNNENINTLTVKSKPYITVVLYLYFKDAGSPDDYYEFTLNEVKAANGVVPVSMVTQIAAYREGDSAASSFYRSAPVQAGFNIKYDSKTIHSASPASLNVDIEVPSADSGQELEFEIRNVGVYTAAAANLIDKATILSAQVAAGQTVPAQTGVVTETATATVYKVKAKVVEYADIFGHPGTGIRLSIPGPFADTTRFTITVNLPEEYTGN